MNKNIQLTNQTGQTIAELLVACFIILIGLAAILTASISILNTVSVSKDIVIATNLAREGLEAARNKRDNNWLAGAVFDDGLNCNLPAPADCGDKKITTLTINKNQIENLNDDSVLLNNCGVACQLKIDATGLYNHTAGNVTKFSRLITLTPICNAATFNPNPPTDPFPKIDMNCSNGASIHPKIGIKLESQVGWQQKGNWRVVTLREYLYDWKLP